MTNPNNQNPIHESEEEARRRWEEVNQNRPTSDAESADTESNYTPEDDGDTANTDSDFLDQLDDENEDHNSSDNKGGLAGWWNGLSQNGRLGVLGGGVVGLAALILALSHLGGSDTDQEPEGINPPDVQTETMTRQPDPGSDNSGARGGADSDRGEPQRPNKQDKDNRREDNPPADNKPDDDQDSADDEPETNEGQGGAPGESGNQHVEDGDVDGRVRNAGKTIHDLMADHTPNNLKGYDELADALEKDGFVPDESVYEAFENAGYLGDNVDVLMQSAAGDPMYFKNNDGTYTVSYEVVSTVMSRDVMDEMGWGNHQRYLYDQLKNQLDNGENTRRLNFDVDPESGRVSVRDTAWWM